MTKDSSSAVLKGSMLSAALNSFMAVMFGAVTFGLNGFILRHVSKETLGIINVRLILLNNTVLFFSRECFRRACLKRPESNHEWRSIVNLLWMSGVDTKLNYLCLFCFVLVKSNTGVLQTPFANKNPKYSFDLLIICFINLKYVFS